MAETPNQGEDFRQAVMEKLQRQIADLGMLERVQAHIQAGGSAKDPWVKDFLNQIDDEV